MTITDTPRHERAPVLVRMTQALEGTRSLDGVAGALGKLSAALVASPRRRRLLQGTSVGHAIHPLLTDFPLGAWTCTTVLDLAGGEQSRPAATLLVGFGVVAAVPAALTGVSEVAPVGARERRVAVVHASSNSAALSCYAASFLARRRGRHAAGVALALAGGMFASVGGYLGGHLTEVRKVASRHPAFEAPESMPPG